MAILTAYPQGDLSGDLANIQIPVDYSSQDGLALALAFSAVSARKVQPKTRLITTAQFRSGNYNFPVPFNYQVSAYRLPMLEPASWAVSSDSVNAYSAVEVYQIGSSSDPMTATFPVQINTTQVAVPGGTLSPLGLNQSVVVIVWKNPNVRIEWALSNITNNGMPDELIKAQSWLAFEVTNIGGTFRVTRWISPAIMYPPAGGDLASFYPTPTIADGAVGTSKLAERAVSTSKIADKAITQDKIQTWSVGPNQLMPGAVKTTNLGSGSVAEERIADKAVTKAKLSTPLQAATHYIPVFATLTYQSPFYTAQSDYAWISSVSYFRTDNSGHKWLITPKSGLSLLGVQVSSNVRLFSFASTYYESGKIAVEFGTDAPLAELTQCVTLNAYIKP